MRLSIVATVVPGTRMFETLALILMGVAMLIYTVSSAETQDTIRALVILALTLAVAVPVLFSIAMLAVVVLLSAYTGVANIVRAYELTNSAIQ